MEKIFVKLDQSAIDNQNLIVRKKLIPVRESIILQIDSSPPNTIFYYDFSKIEGINGSGVDEIISKVIKYLMTVEDKFLFLDHLREEYYEHRYNIDSFLKNRAKIGIVERTSDGPNFLGDISDTQKDILIFVYQNKHTTARIIADEFEKKLSLISTHLNTLYKNRLIRRVEENLEDGGRQFIYKSLF
ncbi:MarR family transcriptional regulator [Lysinibacillus sp. NPDC056959]|uniref:MarR family transcriptional regulator n=1 Tax=Lysinibacillus sp. NPDC056959 TaxID=3345981 RepID=UPI003636082B